MNASKKGNFAGTERVDTSVQGVGVASAEGRFDLIETKSFDPPEGLRLLEYHLARMTASAEELGFAFVGPAARNALQAAPFRLRPQSQARLLLSRLVSLAFEIRAYRSWPEASQEARRVRTR